MATITLTADTLISALMPSGGGSLASGDTIQLAGHSLIVDADAVDYPVTISNSGGDANLELRDLGRIKLNAALPATVHPWIDPAHPLPADFEDESQYITGFTANARAEIQINGNFGLGGGAANLPTATREGAYYSDVSASGSEILFIQNIPLHVGDMIGEAYHAGAQLLRVTAYNPQTRTAIVDGTITRTTTPPPWYVVGGGVVVHRETGTSTILSSNVDAGTLNIVSATNGYMVQNCAIRARRLVVYAGGSGSGGTQRLSDSCIVEADEYAGVSPYTSGTSNVVARLGNCVTATVGWSGNLPNAYGILSIGMGVIQARDFPRLCYDGNANYTLRNVTVGVGLETTSNTSRVHAINTTIKGVLLSDVTLQKAGTITRANNSDYHAPATAADVTWRYADRTIHPGRTLRMICAWMREGAVATRASVAVTDTATWWPQLWPLGADALASVEFTGGTADWRSELLTWRNTGAEAVTVRVWECVTGTVAGGYLRVEDVKGGQL